MPKALERRAVSNTDAKILVQKEAFSAEQAGTWGKQRKPWAQLTSIPASKQARVERTQQRLERRSENLDNYSKTMFKADGYFDYSKTMFNFREHPRG